MWRILESHLQKFKTWKHRRSIHHALALQTRGEMRSDGLKLINTQNRLEIQWRARDIHPWDRDLPAERGSLLFFEQSLADTEAAISRLFDALPEVSVIDLTVMDPASEAMIIAGTVDRSKLEQTRQLLSLRMRIRGLGISYCLVGSRFEPLEHDTGGVEQGDSKQCVK